MIVTSPKLTNQLNKVKELGEILSDEMIGDTRHIKVRVNGTTFAVDQQDCDTLAVAMCWVDASGVGFEYGYNSVQGKTLRTVKNFIVARV